MESNGSSHLWNGIERRQGPYSLSEIEDVFDRGLRSHEVREKQFVDAQFDLIMKAFPEGIDMHAKGHQAQIDAAKEQIEFYRALKVEFAKKSVWGILQILIFLCAAGIAAKFGINLAGIWSQ